MKVRIVKIGNSRGIRIPKPLLEESGLDGEVEIAAQGDSLVISPSKEPRAGWAAAFRAMSERGDDELLGGDRPLSARWDEDEWEWQ